MAKKIILDCDPGHDDALAMTMAVASPKIDLFSGHHLGGEPDSGQNAEQCDADVDPPPP